MQNICDFVLAANTLAGIMDYWMAGLGGCVIPEEGTTEANDRQL